MSNLTNAQLEYWAARPNATGWPANELAQEILRLGAENDALRDQLELVHRCFDGPSNARVFTRQKGGPWRCNGCGFTLADLPAAGEEYRKRREEHHE